MSTWQSSTQQTARVPFIIKSKYFGQYQPQLYIASRSKSKQQDKNILQKMQNRQNKQINSQEQKRNLSQHSVNKEQKSKQKKQPISLQQFMKTRKNNISSNGSASQKIFNWIQKRIINMEFIQNKTVEQTKSWAESDIFASKIKKITYNLFIITKAGKSLSNDCFLQLGMQSVKIQNKSKQNVIEQIQAEKINKYSTPNNFKVAQGYLNTISETQNQYVSSRLQKNQISNSNNESHQQNNLKNLRLSYKEFVKNFDFEKVKNQSTSNSLNYSQSKKLILQDQQLQLKQSRQVSLDQYLTKQNKNSFKSKDKSDLFTEQAIGIQLKTQQQFSTLKQQKSEPINIESSSKVIIRSFRAYQRETGICDSDNFFASIFSYEVKPPLLYPLQIWQDLDQFFQQQHQNYQPFQNSHSQMMQIMVKKQNCDFQKQIKSAANQYISNNLIGVSEQKPFKNRIEPFQNNRKIQEKQAQISQKSNYASQNYTQNKGPSNIQSYYFSQRNILLPQSLQANQNNPVFTFQRILSKQEKTTQDRNTIVHHRNIISPFQSVHMQQDIRSNRFIGQNRSNEKSECSSKKSSKPRVFFHYLSPSQNLKDKNKVQAVSRPPVNKISFRQSKANKNNLAESKQKKSNQTQVKVQSSNIQYIKHLKGQQQRNQVFHRKQNIIPLPLARYRSQSGFIAQRIGIQQHNRNHQINSNQQYFPPYNYVNYVTVSNGIGNYQQNQMRNNMIRQSQCFANTNQKFVMENRFRLIPKRRTRSLNQKLLVTCAKQLLV